MRLFTAIIVILTLVSCTGSVINKEQVKQIIYQEEKAFEAMLKKEGIAQAFAYYADSNAVILRGEEKLIQGKKAIFEYYSSDKFNDVDLSWTPNFIDVSDDGTMAYTYGKYIWKQKMGVDTFQTIEGIFHTVWKKQKDGSWKYVWD